MFIVVLAIMPGMCHAESNDDPVFQEIDELIAKLPYYFNVSSDSGLIMAQKALRKSELNNYDVGRINALRGMAIFYQQMGEYKLATEYIESAYKFAEKHNDEVLLAAVLFSRGYVNAENTRYDKAYEDYTRSTDIYLKKGDSVRYAYILNNFANLHLFRKEYEKAIELYEISLSISRKSEFYGQALLTIINIGSYYLGEETSAEVVNLDSAIRYYQEAVTMVKDDDYRHKAMVYQGLGSAYLKLDSIQQAEIYILDAIKSAEILSEKKTIGFAYGMLGEVYKKKNELDKAIKFLEKGHAILAEGKDYFLLKIAANNIAEVYKENNDFEKALYYSDLMSIYNDSLNNKQNTERLAKLRAAKEYEEKIAKEEALYKKRIGIIVGLSVVLALSIVFFIRGYYRQRKKAKLSELGKTELEKNLKQKDVDLLTKTMHLNEKEELIHGLEEKLKQISRDMKPSKSKDVQSLISEIRVSKSDNIWQEFESRFSSVNDDFLDRLKKKFPDLTPKELRLCSLLRLNLSTKEISALTHQNPLSINKARFRLRKKLDLNNSEVNLTTFIMDF